MFFFFFFPIVILEFRRFWIECMDGILVEDSGLSNEFLLLGQLLFGHSIGWATVLSPYP